MFLLDTDVVCELRKAGDGSADPHVTAWAAEVATGRLYLSALSVFEIERSIALMERSDRRRAALLAAWLHQQVLPAFADRILPIDTAVAQCHARMPMATPDAERDALLAATAIVHNMTVVTGKTGNYAATGARLLDPWQATH
ncbi:PIN domain-containing protein [Derxia gummosa]|uniref:PIN domain-containing protein n=1 Tax=Derxia gummosa DSM 723 TaxID=1121388 RepID=A0ABD8F6K1_9BURK